MTVGPILARLRRATGPLHERLESDLRVVDRLASPGERPAMVAGYERLDTAVAAYIASASGAEALGARYVMEGAKLGGRVIRRDLAAAGADLEGLEFLAPEGAETAERWRAFVAMLEERGAHDPEGVERGALVAFALAGRCLAWSATPA